ncbi:MAG: TIGR01440 family protein [Ruminococcaceae bacterium]|nr:TIGR01440 family protein [Oscillospiraceae bacterium]
MKELKTNSDGTLSFEGDAQELLTGLREQAEIVARELLDAAELKAGQILVVGCSTSEVIGRTIGKASVPEAAKAVFEGIYSVARERGIFLAAQCCEHLNRALIVEAECAERYGFDAVCVRPIPKAGGSFATVAFESFDAPVAVEAIRAHAGLDIGGTLVGMHLRAVAVPVRLSLSKIGEANIISARTRPKYIGGPRAQY